MLVRYICDRKRRGVITINGDRNVLEAARLMMQHKIGALVIVGAERRVIGIFTERDFMRLVANKGNAALSLTVAEVMTRAVLTCTTGMTVEEVMDVMTEKKFRHMPVVNNWSLIGIVSIGDLVRHRRDEAEREAAAAREYIQTA